MHSLAIALKLKGLEVTGSDDNFYDPSRQRLIDNDLLPKKIGWDEANITEDLDAVILGMHAVADNPELIKAKKLGLVGAVFLGVMAILPYFARLLTRLVTGTTTTTSMLVTSTGLIIVVGVVLDTMKQLEAQLLMRHYEGFLKR